MKNTDNTINNFEIAEELFPTDLPLLPTEIFNKFIENLITENPELKKLSLIELKDNPKFQQALQEYLVKNHLSTPTLDVLKSIIPKNHVKPNNKLANKITKGIVDEGEFDLVVSGKKAKKEVFTKVMLTYDEKYVQFSGREKYMPYDREVYDGVVTLYEAGNDLITPAMVYRAMNGLTDSEYIKPEALETVRRSLDKSRRIYMTIDYTDEAKLYNKNIQKTTYEGYMLAANKVTIKINDKEQEGYKILGKPILYEYAQISGQIITVPIKLLQTKDAVRGTDEVIVIRGYLLRQIEWIKNDKTTRSDNITYQGIYEELSILRTALDSKAYENKTRKIRNHVKAVLDEWIDEGYILKYEEYKERNAIKGVTIMPV